MFCFVRSRLLSYQLELTDPLFSSIFFRSSLLGLTSIARYEYKRNRMEQQILASYTKSPLFILKDNEVEGGQEEIVPSLFAFYAIFAVYRY